MNFSVQNNSLLQPVRSGHSLRQFVVHGRSLQKGRIFVPFFLLCICAHPLVTRGRVLVNAAVPGQPTFAVRPSPSPWSRSTRGSSHWS